MPEVDVLAALGLKEEEPEAKEAEKVKEEDKAENRFRTTFLKGDMVIVPGETPADVMARKAVFGPIFGLNSKKSLEDKIRILHYRINERWTNIIRQYASGQSQLPTLLEKIRNCPPAGGYWISVKKRRAKLKKHERPFGTRQMCERAKYCPWCFYRRHKKLHGKIAALEGPMRGLVITTAGTPDDVIKLRNGVMIWCRRTLGARSAVAFLRPTQDYISPERSKYQFGLLVEGGREELNLLDGITAKLATYNCSTRLPHFEVLFEREEKNGKEMADRLHRWMPYQALYMLPRNLQLEKLLLEDNKDYNEPGLKKLMRDSVDRMTATQVQLAIKGMCRSTTNRETTRTNSRRSLPKWRDLVSYPKELLDGVGMCR